MGKETVFTHQSSRDGEGQPIRANGNDKSDAFLPFLVLQ